MLATGRKDGQGEMSEPRQAMPVAYAGSGALERRCSSCSGKPRTRSDVADLEIVWLVDVGEGKPAAARFCRTCRPRGRVEEVACEDCGDGPLLSGVFADPADLFTAAALQEWLDETGWTHGTICPNCSAAAEGNAPAARSAFPVGHS